MSPITGDFSSTRRHQGENLERTRFASAFYVPAKPKHVETMRGTDANARSGLVDEMLELRKALQ